MTQSLTYIILAAGVESGLQQLTLQYPKTSYKLDENTTILQRMVRLIRHSDHDAEIVIVIGYMADKIRQELADENVKFVVNPFYETTNSIASVWFAREYLERENVVLLNGDVVFENKIIEDYLTKWTDYPYIFLDSSIHCPGAYNVTVKDDRVLVMSKKIEHFTGKYACATKLDAVSARLLKQEVDTMILSNMYGQYFEDTLVQMIMFNDFHLYFKDLSQKKWSEINTVDDLLLAKEIHQKELSL